MSDWTVAARCRGSEVDVFFVRSLPEAREALKLCTRCEVKQDCLEYAVDEGIELGVWGGLTERQRRAYARRTQTNVA